MVTIVAALNERGIAVTASNLAKVLYRARKSQKPVTCRSNGQSTAVAEPPPQPTKKASLYSVPPGVDPAKWARMSLREQGAYDTDKYLNARPRLFAAKTDFPVRPPPAQEAC